MISTADPRLPGRFWLKVEESQSGCWLWNGSKTLGYGQITWRTNRGWRPRRAHRIAYEALVGVVPEGLELDHLCRVKNCVNPVHLEPVTRSVNTKRGDSGKRWTHCKHGHALTSDNMIEYTMANGNTGRRCRTCHNEVNKRARERKKYGRV